MLSFRHKLAFGEIQAFEKSVAAHRALKGQRLTGISLCGTTSGATLIVPKNMLEEFSRSCTSSLEAFSKRRFQRAVDLYLGRR